MSHNLFNTFREFDAGNGKKGNLYSLAALEEAGVGRISRLPISIRIVLESVLRNYDGRKITETHVACLLLRLKSMTGLPLLILQSRHFSKTFP